MVLVKCCDISNELRPLEVAEPWLDCLLEEYFNQVAGSSTSTFLETSAWNQGSLKGARSPGQFRRDLMPIDHPGINRAGRRV